MYKKGTVVLTPFPFTDLSGTKVRPAVIVSKGKIGNDVVLLFITSKQKKTAKCSVAVSPDDDNGLKTPSSIVCSKVATIEAKVVLGELGSLSAALQKRVDVELKKVLGL